MKCRVCVTCTGYGYYRGSRSRTCSTLAQPAVTRVTWLPNQATMCQYYSGSSMLCIFKLLHRRLGPMTPQEYVYFNLSISLTISSYRSSAHTPCTHGCPPAVSIMMWNNNMHGQRHGSMTMAPTVTTRRRRTDDGDNAWHEGDEGHWRWQQQQRMTQRQQCSHIVE